MDYQKGQSRRQIKHNHPRVRFADGVPRQDNIIPYVKGVVDAMVTGNTHYTNSYWSENVRQRIEDFLNKHFHVGHNSSFKFAVVEHDTVFEVIIYDGCDDICRNECTTIPNREWWKWCLFKVGL